MKAGTQIILSLLILILIMGCQFFYQSPTGSITLNQTTFDYGETINVNLSVDSDPNSTVNVLWKLNKDNLAIDIEDPYSFSFTLTPEVTTTYTLQAVISDGQETITIDKDFVVQQIPFLGTWKATAVDCPATSYLMDIVGIWYMNGFELYYLDANGGEIARQYSAKGTMTFPLENEWITLTEEYSWDESSANWQEWTYNDGIMYAKYNFVDDKLHMTVLLDMTTPADTAEYTWEFTKVDDSVDAWF